MTSEGEWQYLPPGANLDRLWTPWRAQYVGEPQTSGCFLCRLGAASPELDATNLVLHRERDVFLLLNRFPYNTGHVLIAPLMHVGDFTALDRNLLDALFLLTQRAIKALDEAYRPQGFNVGLNLGSVAGAGVPEHLHVHAVPRWAGDTSFMTAISETKVLPESLTQTYKRLLPHLG